MSKTDIKIQPKVNMPERMRVCNSSEYNIFLKNRGKFFCLIKKILPHWYSRGGAKQRGANNQYSDELILTMHTVSYITSSALRQTVGIFEEYVEQCNLNFVVPNFSTMSRKLQRLNVEGFFARFKRIFGFSFKNKSEINREQELMIKCNILNYFNSIGVAKFELAT